MERRHAKDVGDPRGYPGVLRKELCSGRCVHGLDVGHSVDTETAKRSYGTASQHQVAPPRTVGQRFGSRATVSDGERAIRDIRLSRSTASVLRPYGQIEIPKKFRVSRASSDAPCNECGCTPQRAGTQVQIGMQGGSAHAALDGEPGCRRE